MSSSREGAWARADNGVRASRPAVAATNRSLTYLSRATREEWGR
jgi:hypothetical protein